MRDFILEEELENVINQNTKKYLGEVVLSYNAGNYRATVVVLYTTVIYDLLQKLVALKEIYNDKGAEKILDDITEQQKKNPKSPEWESSLIEKIYKETKIISAVEKEELLYLKSERNYAAHPIINFDDMNDQLELKAITKETARDLIRKAFEIVFLKDAILAKDILQDFVVDLKEFYARVKTDGLENFLKTKYFNRMTMERKNQLFKTLWKFVFLLDNDDCNKDRKSSYWGLVYLYNEDKKHYMDIVRNNEDIYLNKLKLETIEGWGGKSCKGIDRIDIFYFNLTSRIVYFVRFLEYAPEMYRNLNDHARNIVKQSIEHMYMKEDVAENAFYQTADQNADAFEEQVRLKAKALFMSDDMAHHFESIHKMITNYANTRKGWFDSGHYDVLNAEDLKQIFYQSEQRGCIEQFIEFLIRYCTKAHSFGQAHQMFEYIKDYQGSYKQKHYYMILGGMNDNPQYYDNNSLGTFVKTLEEMYLNSFHTKLFKELEEKYLYRNLFSNIKIEDCDVKRILELIEGRAVYFTCWNLRTLISGLDEEQCHNILKKEKSSSFSNILKVLSDKDAPGYSESFLKRFKGYFG